MVYARQLPDPDLLIRTSAALLISNFLLWQLAYSELVFTDTLWPDFGREELEQALAAYASRRGRFRGGGGRSGPASWCRSSGCPLCSASSGSAGGGSGFSRRWGA